MATKLSLKALDKRLNEQQKQIDALAEQVAVPREPFGVISTGNPESVSSDGPYRVGVIDWPSKEAFEEYKAQVETLGGRIMENGTAQFSYSPSDPTGVHARDESGQNPNSVQPVPPAWDLQQMVQRKGLKSREPQPITGINYKQGQVTTRLWDDSEGWKEGSWGWQLLHNVTLDGPQE